MLNPTIHKKILIQILKSIYSDSQIGSSLGFKGGTAALMFYNLPRFSVDLDFDLLNISQEDQVFKKLPLLLAQFGELFESRKKRFTLFFLLSYKKGERMVKIEISRRPTPSSYEIKSYLGIPMKVVSQSDMVAGKMAALVTRKKLAARDIFDTWFFLQNNWEPNETTLLQKTGLSKPMVLQKAIKIIQNLDQPKFLEGLGELVDEGQKYWIKNKLKDEILFLLKLNLES